MFTEAEMLAIKKRLQSDVRRLTLLCRDCTRQAEGRRLIFPVDFSEIFARMYGRTSPRQPLSAEVRALLKRVLQQSGPGGTYELTVLPGTIWEILAHLNFVAAAVGTTAPEALRQILQREEVKQFYEAVKGDADSATEAYSAFGGMATVMTLLREASGVGAAFGTPLKRFIALVEGGHVIPVENIVPDLMGVQVTPGFASTLANELRQEKSIDSTMTTDAIIADAANYSLNLSLNKNLYDSSNLYFAMLMRQQVAKTVFDRHPWDGDPLKGRFSETDPICTREPFYCQQAINVAEREADPEARAAMLRGAITQTAEVRDTIGDRAKELGEALQALEANVYQLTTDEVRTFLARFLAWEAHVYEPVLQLLAEVRPGTTKQADDDAVVPNGDIPGLLGRAIELASSLQRDRDLISRLVPDLPHVGGTGH